ncbi:MAG: gfo/Idh/MocA family oxidoreductase, partial [Pseudorhodobacter sp.]|nr:gfo/Idh/MocA family oxidoreductase [Pseudorhodobacter sp.]
GRFWPDHLGAPPVPRVIVSPRDPKGPRELEVPVDPALLAAGDHNGSTYYQHRGFADVILGRRLPEVTLKDGWWAVAIGLAAQQSARTGQSVALSGFGEA